jgi:hypothetical protein
MIPRPRARLLVPLVLLLACGEGAEQTALDAARADSSAAGYAVGGTAVTTATVTTATQLAVPSETTTVAARHDTSAAHPASPKRDSARATAAKATPHRDSTHVARRDSVPAKRTATTAAATTVAPRVQPEPAGPVRVNEFLTYDMKTRTASLQLIAGYNGVNESLNYNGVTRGTRAVAIPLGWRVHITVANRDPDLQHSAIVVDEVLPPPLELTTPAFPGAALPHADEGLQDDETGTIDFVTNHTGRFMIACGVAGHAQSGMWLRLVVTQGLSVPAYR